MVRMSRWLYVGLALIYLSFILEEAYQVTKIVYAPIGILGLVLVVIAFIKYLVDESRGIRAIEEKNAKTKAEFMAEVKGFWFEWYFKFQPKYATQPRYEKEILLNLALQAKNLGELCSNLAADNSPANQKKYGSSLSRYQNSIIQLEKHHPVLAAKLPHWSELELFVSEWLKAHKL